MVSIPVLSLRVGEHSAGDTWGVSCGLLTDLFPDGSMLWFVFGRDRVCDAEMRELLRVETCVHRNEVYPD